MKRIVIVFAAMLAALPMGAQAQQADVRLEEVVVTADRVQSATGETTSSVVVITREQIEKMNVSFAADVLRNVADLNHVQNGGAGQTAAVFMRGGDSTHTQVMIDGVKIKSTTAGMFDFAGLTSEDIERIEIVKGPQSTLYGSEAMAGVINIITKKGKGSLKTEVVFEAGSFGTRKPAASVSGGNDNMDYRISGSYLTTEGISAAADGSEKDGYRNSTVSGRIGVSPSEHFALELIGRYNRDRADLDGFDFFTKRATDDLNYVQYGDHSMIAAKGKTYFGIWEQVLTVSTIRDAIRSRDPDTFYNNYDIVSGMDSIDWQNNIKFSDTYLLTVGLENRKEKGENTGNFSTDLHNRAVYLNARLKIDEGRLIVNAGLRDDDHDLSGFKSTYRTGILYTINDFSFKFKGNYGTGFRAPSFNELFYPFYGDPSLKPEESTAWDLGFEKGIAKDKILLSVTYFDQQYKNLIQTDPNTFTAANIAQASIRGIETSISFKAADSVTVKVGQTHLDTEDKETGKPLSRRPKDKFTLAAGYTSTKMSLLISYAFVGQRYDSSVGRNLSSYNLVGLSGNYSLSKWLAVFARIDNVFNTNYEEAGSYGTPGFSTLAGIKITSL
ncbi:MAG: TonB-dependent receptor domain-containing protein [Nitrospirota bacterium]